MRSNSFRIECARPSDLQDVLTLNEATREAPSWRADLLEPFVAGREGSLASKVLLLARDSEDRLCGWLAGTQVGEITELEFLLISPPRRRQGFGRLLMQSWMAMATEQHATEMLLEVRASNRAAQGLYRSMGFVEQGRRPKYYREPVEDAILMRSELSGMPFRDAAG